MLDTVLQKVRIQSRYQVPSTSLASAYITALQVLHQIKPSAVEDRTLQGMKLLVSEGNDPISQAVIELAFLAGIDVVFATADEKYHKALREKGAIPLPLENEQWLPIVKENMDIVIDGICQDNFESPHAELNKNEKRITIGMAFIMNKEENRLFGMPLCAIYNSFKSDFLMTNTASYCLWQSSQQKPDEWKVSNFYSKFNQLHFIY